MAMMIGSTHLAQTNPRLAQANQGEFTTHKIHSRGIENGRSMSGTQALICNSSDLTNAAIPVIHDQSICGSSAVINAPRPEQREQHLQRGERDVARGVERRVLALKLCQPGRTRSRRWLERCFIDLGLCLTSVALLDKHTPGDVPTPPSPLYHDRNCISLETATIPQRRLLLIDLLAIDEQPCDVGKTGSGHLYLDAMPCVVKGIPGAGGLGLLHAISHILRTHCVYAAECSARYVLPHPPADALCVRLAARTFSAARRRTPCLPAGWGARRPVLYSNTTW